MDVPAYLTFVIVSAAQSATPGPSTLFIVNNAVAHGWRRALGALSGDLAAIAMLATLSVVGLGALLETYPAALLSLRLAGAGYIVWLGWSFLRPARRRAGSIAAETPLPQSGLLLWVQSFGVGISNPKAVLFFAALFPQFLPPNSGSAVLALLVGTFLVVKFVVLGGYALGARHVVRLLAKPDHARRGRMLTGILFMLFGVVMLWSALSATWGSGGGW
ncbi:LysE family translocator [Rubrimonas cliftonensis]|uniref:Threonine/homoserine/homoserine lactone efflux protein n=1 Tax=Rubrimonas cliftonensis TaxID=89524 RepID=A0A1H4FS04_9RHOB|nr:LysE family translocator [Rubrimonas cliftonensis]SEB00129.1 Threonine/homoserine/homoserine lactone efflux protein [Rubrimonas cliftonensis]